MQSSVTSLPLLLNCQAKHSHEMHDKTRTAPGRNTCLSPWRHTDTTTLLMQHMRGTSAISIMLPPARGMPTGFGHVHTRVCATYESFVATQVPMPRFVTMQSNAPQNARNPCETTVRQLEPMPPTDELRLRKWSSGRAAQLRTTTCQSCQHQSRQPQGYTHRSSTDATLAERSTIARTRGQTAPAAGARAAEPPTIAFHAASRTIARS